MSKRFGNLLIGKTYSLTVLRRRIYLFREGERSMILPVSIHCNTCANRMPQGTNLNYVRRRSLSKTSLGAPIVTFFFNCTKCRALIRMKEDPENSGYVVEDGATEVLEHENQNTFERFVMKMVWILKHLTLI
ncbi:putative CWC16 protein [Rosa chinensis]|uniref:Putative CWC16 protein n=1 Tax=Rosa chinensis TaxID=74649 RepID=A0A2P6PG73_ROSCH|nr:putative CWC16 protein [Rosa chinensis]